MNPEADENFMEYTDLIVRKEGPIMTVVLNRPEALNTLSIRLLRELRHLALNLQDDPETGAVILTGGTGMFSAGLDLKDSEVQKMLSGSAEERRERVWLGRAVCDALADVPQVTIAALEGFCVGGGVSLAISCDWRIMGRAAFMHIPEIDLGLNYSWGSIPRLVHLVGPAKAKQMIILAERIPAEQCALWGLADKVVSGGSTLDASISLADKVLEKPPIPVAMTKQAVNMVFHAHDRSGIHMDADQFMLTTYTQDHREGLAAFLEKRKPEFKGK